jgi:hypothetical protein
MNDNLYHWRAPVGSTSPDCPAVGGKGSGEGSRPLVAS